MTCLALLGLACLLLLAAPQISGRCAAQASTREQSVVTNYQAITHQSGASPKKILHGLGLVLTVGLTVLFVRFVRNEAIAARQAELAGWAVPQDEDETTAEVVGTSSASSFNDELEASPQPSDASEPEPETNSIPPERNSIAPDWSSRTRLIYHVGNYHFACDREVLAGPTQSHLQDLCDALCDDDNTRRVVRVASGLSSRYAKSQVTAQLAQMLADRPDVRVLVLEGDLDAPALHKVLRVNVPRSYGLSEQLQGMAELDRVETATVMQLSPSLHALVESRWSTPAALGLPQYAELIMSQRDVYDFIVIDGPVVDSWPDADHFARSVDGVVFVTLAGTRLPDTLTLLGQHFAHDLLLRIVKTGEPTGS
jgi:Mrp family chromosome partitioning ATPase